MEFNLIPLIKEVGPYLGLMFFFVWRDYRREEALVKENNAKDAFIQKELMSLIDKVNEMLARATEALNRGK